MMRSWMRVLIVGAALTGAPYAAMAEPAESAKEEAALQKRAEAFVEAFNKGDAKALAGFYTAEADAIDADGQHLKGRKAIEEGYTKLFAQVKGAKLLIRINSVRVPTSTLAIEDGVTEVVMPEGPPASARYTVIHVKVDGQWMIESVREAPALPPSNAKHLEDLAFLVGEWAEDGEAGGKSRALYSWAEQGNFLLNTFDLTRKDVSVGGGTQFIGWDAATKQPRSWAFVSNGGFAEGVWKKDGEAWNIGLTASLPDGSKMTAINVFKKIDNNHFSIRLIKRALDGKPLPDEKEIKMKRIR
jgi:uncharacterized protein (TIGR02246 family)